MMNSFKQAMHYEQDQKNSSPSGGSGKKEEDTQEVASFLLTLKHRSVTPEPLPEQLDHHAHRPQPSYSPAYGYPQVAYDMPPYSELTPGLMDEHGSADMPWDLLLNGSKLVFMKDRDLVPDCLFVAMAQMKVCKLTQADRVGCYKAREIGFTGMCCKHCGGQPGFGRYYPNSVRSLAQTTTSQTILKHIGNKCRFCPPHIRQAVLELQRQQAVKEGMACGRPRYGSRKIFFQRVWSRLHGGPAEDDDECPKQVDESSLASEDEPQVPPMKEVTAPQGKRKLSRFGILPTQRNVKRKLDGKIPHNLVMPKAG